MASTFTKILFALRRFPGVGPRTAERMAFHLLSMKREDFDFFYQTLGAFRSKTKVCSTCGLISENDPCRICTDPRRKTQLLCVVKDVEDAFHVEKARAHDGKYHVLGGLVSPLESIQESDLSLDRLAARCAQGVEEILFAMERTVEAEVTEKAVMRRLSKFSGLKFSRLASGIPAGAGLEHLDGDTLRTAVERRTPVTAAGQTKTP